MDTIEPYGSASLRRCSTRSIRTASRHTTWRCAGGEENWKTSDLIFASIYRLLAWPSEKGNDCYILANDEEQAGDIWVGKEDNRDEFRPGQEVQVLQKEIVRKDGRGKLQILPARDAVGQHGKTYLMAAFDEIHGYRSHDLFEALAPDPTRQDVLIWITSYAGIRHAPGIPLYDLMQAGKRGDDPRLFFSWYGGDYTTDTELADAAPEQRANPSMAGWKNPGYLPQQRAGCHAQVSPPSSKLARRTDGAALSGEHVVSAIVTGRKRLPESLACGILRLWT